MNYEALGRYIAARAGEASTWRGIVLILTAIGVQFSPEQAEAVVAAGLFVSGLIGAAFPDPKGGNHGA